MCIFIKFERLQYSICIYEIIKIYFDKLKDDIRIGIKGACGQLEIILCNRITIEHSHFL